MSTPQTIAIFGPGKVGMAIARLAVAAGYRTLVVRSPRQDKLQWILDVVANGAEEAISSEQVRDEAGLIILAVPFFKSEALPYGIFSGKIVIDAMNYWAPIDGLVEAKELDPRSSTEFVADRNPDARWVKSLNHLGYHDMEEHPKPAGDPARRALAAASDDGDARQTVMHFIDSLGFDPVDAGPLANGRFLESDMPVFGQELRKGALEAMLLAEQSKEE